MDKAKKEAIMNAQTFDELLDAEYGKPGTPEREQFDGDGSGIMSGRDSQEGRCGAEARQQNRVPVK